MSKIALRKHLEAYESTPQAWKTDHDDAMFCCDVQDSLQFGLLILQQMNELDEAIRLEAFTGKLAAEVAADLCLEIERNFHQWLTASLAHLDVIAVLHAKGFSVAGAGRFRSAVDEVRAILTPDKDFFAGAGLVDLRDNALDAHARDETTEWSPSN